MTEFEIIEGCKNKDPRSQRALFDRFAGKMMGVCLRYANDAAGPSRIQGLRNNSRYEVIKGKPYIVASRNIKPGEEILVGYGKDYWDTMMED